MKRFRRFWIASRKRLPHDRRDVVSITRSQFTRDGACDVKYMDPIEAVIDPVPALTRAIDKDSSQTSRFGQVCVEKAKRQSDHL